MSKNKPMIVQSVYFRWAVSRRGETYYADGRSGNKGAKLRRYTLDVADETAALKQLKILDLKMAVKAGLVRPTESTDLSTTSTRTLPIREGIDLYLSYCRRPQVSKGVRPRTLARYRAVLDKFGRFAASVGVGDWAQVGRNILNQYGTWLEDNDYAFATSYIEITVLKQCVKYFVAENRLPETAKLVFKLAKPAETTAYCPTGSEVAEILKVSREDPKLGWFADVVVALAFTGLRIGELRDLCWDDLDEELKNLTVPDYSKQGTKRERSNARENKGKKSRTLPVEQSTFRLVLERLSKTPCKDGLIFHGPGGGRIKPDRVRLVLKNRVLPRVLERLGPKGRRNASKSSQAKSLKDLTPHGLRHFFVSVCACGGVAEMTVVRWLGHHDSKITRRYFHLRDAESHQQIEKVTFFKTLSEAGPEGGTLPSSPAA